MPFVAELSDLPRRPLWKAADDLPQQVMESLPGVGPGRRVTVPQAIVA